MELLATAITGDKSVSWRYRTNDLLEAIDPHTIAQYPKLLVIYKLVLTYLVCHSDSNNIPCNERVNEGVLITDVAIY